VAPRDGRSTGPPAPRTPGRLGHGHSLPGPWTRRPVPQSGASLRGTVLPGASLRGTVPFPGASLRGTVPSGRRLAGPRPSPGRRLPRRVAQGMPADYRLGSLAPRRAREHTATRTDRPGRSMNLTSSPAVVVKSFGTWGAVQWRRGIASREVRALGGPRRNSCPSAGLAAPRPSRPDPRSGRCPGRRRGPRSRGADRGCRCRAHSARP